MTPEERIDAALDSVLIFTGMTLFDYENYPAQLKGMREAMRKIMSDSFNDGIASTLVVREVFNKK